MAAQPIETAPRDGKVIIVSDGSNMARAFWRDGAPGMWAYPAPESVELIVQVDFKPTRWSDTAADFLDGPGAA